MNPWPFVIAAYGVAVGLTAALLLWAYVSMRRAEAGTLPAVYPNPLAPLGIDAAGRKR